MTNYSKNLQQYYHLHFFFELDELDQVTLIHETITQILSSIVKLYPLLLRPAGPLLKPMFMLKFEQKILNHIMEFFQPYPANYSILIHPELENELLAHTQYATWLGGKELSLRLEYLD